MIARRPFGGQRIMHCSMADIGRSERVVPGVEFTVVDDAGMIRRCRV